MTLRPARRRRYALSQYATVRGFSLAARMVWFLFSSARRRPTKLQSADALAVGCIDLLGGSARMDIRMSRAIASLYTDPPIYWECLYSMQRKQGQRTTSTSTDPPAVTAFPSSFRT